MAQTTLCRDTGELLERYADTVVRAAYGMVKNRHDAEDIAQEVFLSVLRAQPAFESPDHERAFLLRATINRCKSFFRSGWQRKTEGLAEDLAAPVSFTESENLVLDAVAKLPEKYRKVIYLHYIEGYAAREISDILSVPQNTVLTHLARGRKLLKTMLKGDFDDV